MPGLNLKDLDPDLSGPIASNSPIPWLSQVNKSISEFKEVLAMLKGLKGANLSQLGTELQNSSAGVDKKNIGNIFGIVNALGLGDMPIGKIIEQIAPYSINQLQEMGGKYLESKPEK